MIKLNVKDKSAFPNTETTGIIVNLENENTKLPGKIKLIAFNIGLFKFIMADSKNPLTMTNTAMLITVDVFLLIDEIKVVNAVRVSVPISPNLIIFPITSPKL